MSIVLEKIRKLPNQPGCYIYKDSRGDILYIGKAKDLKKRVGSYFTKQIDIKTRQLVDRIHDLDFVVTDNEIEAWLLEAQMIGKHQPPYNMELKGGVRYAYIRITDEAFPRLETARMVDKKDIIYGPFADSVSRKQLIGLANRLFKLRTGKTKAVKIGDAFRIRCSVPPWNRIVTPEQYQQDIENVKLLLQGKMDFLKERLSQEMKSYAAQNKFELAKIRRDQLNALHYLHEEQKVQLRKTYDQDVIAFLRETSTLVLEVMSINKGVVTGREQFRLPIVDGGQTNEQLLSTFIRQHYYQSSMPQELIVPTVPSEAKTLEQYLTTLALRKVAIIAPQRGGKRKLLQMVEKNLITRLTYGAEGVLELQQALSLPVPPRTIEMFDISNLGSTDIVASMVYFFDGKPDKSNYRRFKIRHQKGQSDVDAMAEVVYRRYYRLKTEHQRFPDLVLVDGGKAQLSAALESLTKLDLQLPIAALAKQEEELFIPGQSESIRLSKKSPALKLVQRVRDEAHRFAITYHRLLRKKRLMK